MTASRTYDVCMLHAGDTLDGSHPGWHSLVAAGFAAERIDAVLFSHREPHRVYHDQRHLAQILDDAAHLLIELSPAQALAVLFHDAVYVPGAMSGANEALSAQLLRVYAQGIDAAIVRQAASIVIDTAQHLPTSEAAAAVLDLDLLRLAAAADEFEQYSRELFFELHPLTPAIDGERWRSFTARRALAFERLLARPRIYSTPQCLLRFESAARANLRAAIEHQPSG